MRIENLFGGKHFCNRAVILAFSWICGLLAGCLIGAVKDESLKIVLLAAKKNPGIFQMFPARLLMPALVSFMTYLSKERWIYLACFLRMYLFGHTVFLIRSAFGISSWLVNSLLMLPSVLLLVPTFWFCLRRLTAGKASFGNDFARVAAFISIVTAFDCFVIAPFLETVIV